jgi:ketosteroid isomerase-like protein
MTSTPAEIAEAFSRHHFADAFPYLAPDVRWVAHGAEETVGRDAVVAVCEDTLAQLRDSTTTFRSFRTVVGTDAVVVDVVAHYEQPDGEFVVASCDLYDFADGLVTAITSYTVAL